MRRRRNACLASLEHLRRSCSDLSFSDAIAFLYVCENEGINLSELAQLAGLSSSAVSRCAHRLAALDLLIIDRQDRDGRGRIVRLTSRARALRFELNDLVLEATPILAG